jgi:Arc/MetJ-type ribon-helix-helix transcriptional regulator
MDKLEATIVLPPRLAEQIQEQIRQGWFTDMNSLVIEALRRYLETRSSEMTARWINNDVVWGLSGEE